MTNYWNPYDYSLENQLSDMLRYGDVYASDDGTVMKDHGDYVEMNFPSDNEKGHISYDYYNDGSWREHKNN